jgi:hypothetical protein
MVFMTRCVPPFGAPGDVGRHRAADPAPQRARLKP